MKKIKVKIGREIYEMPEANLRRPDMKNFLKEAKVLTRGIKIPKPKPKRIKRKPKIRKPKIRKPKPPRRKRIKRYRKKRRIPIHKQKARKMTGIEYRNLRRIPKKYGINPDVVDLEARIDKSLTYDENKTIISNFVKQLGRKTNFSMEGVEAQRSEYIDDLKFKAQAGSVNARRELRALRKSGYI